MKKNESKNSNPLSYQAALERLEHLVSQFEQEHVNIDDLAKKTKEVSQLISFCKKRLRDTENQVNSNL